MQFLVAFSCLLAVASAGFINAPVVAPAVAYAAAYDDGSYKGEGLYESAYKGEGIIEAQPLARVAAVAAPVAYAAHTYAAPAVAHTYAAPAVAHTYAAAPVIAKASHAVAYKAPLVSAPHPVPVAHTYAAPYAYAGPVAHAYAAPIAQTYAHTYAAPIHHAVAAPAVALASEARLVDPVAIAAGAPLPTGDTVEVAAAKASHFAAHAAAKGHFIAKRSPVYVGAYASPLAYSGYTGYTGYAAPLAHSYGYSGYAAPYSYGYGRLGAFYG